jgi:hypothetical protein
MADFTSAGFTQLDAWPDSGANGKRRLAIKCTLNLSAAGSGAASNKIPASALGLKSIEEVSGFVKSDNTVVVPASPNATGDEILLGGGASSATTSYTGLFTTIVKGQTLANNS